MLAALLCQPATSATGFDPSAWYRHELQVALLRQVDDEIEADDEEFLLLLKG